MKNTEIAATFTADDGGIVANVYPNNGSGYRVVVSDQNGKELDRIYFAGLDVATQFARDATN